MPARPPAWTASLRPGYADLLELDWGVSIIDWAGERLVERPAGISRHEVRFVTSAGGVCAVKQLPLEAARREHRLLRLLEDAGGPAVAAVGLVERAGVDPGSELAALVVTRFAEQSFPYRHLLSGPGFGSHRGQLLDAVALLLVELHLLGFYWGDCSLSNVLYRYDADAIETIMVDAETTSAYPALSHGQRGQDIEIMVENVGGEMGDLAAASGLGLDAADLGMGEEIAVRYRALWTELAAEWIVPSGQEYRITERVHRLNELGFEVDEIEAAQHRERDHLHFRVRVGGRGFNSNRLRLLTGLQAGENQARQLLADLAYFTRSQGPAGAGQGPGVGRAVSAVRWRAEALEPVLARITPEHGGRDALQAYCDLLHHRYLVSAAAGRDVGTQAALESWLAQGRPGYRI